MRKILLFLLILVVTSCSGARTNLPEGIILNKSGESREKIRYYDAPKIIEDQKESFSSSTSFPEVKIALLVPLSGNFKKLGQTMLDAAQLALFRLNESNMIIIPIDTKGTAFGASEAAKEAVSKGVKIILGPVFSSSAKAVLPIAKENDINVISFSNDKMLSNSGVFAIGFLPEEPVKRVVNFAMSRGIDEFAAILPNNAFGAAAGKELRETVARNSEAAVMKAEFYQTDKKGNSVNLKRHVFSSYDSIMHNRPPKDYDKELEAFNDNPLKFPRSLLITDSGENLEEITRLLKKYNFNSEKLQILGSSKWYNDEILKNPVLEGAWFAATPRDRRTLFDDKFKEIYGYEPSELSSLAYDGVALVATLARISNGEDFSASAISNPRGFVGIDGIFKFREDGLCERGLAVIQVQNGQFAEISPSPASFFDIISSDDKKDGPSTEHRED